MLKLQSGSGLNLGNIGAAMTEGLGFILIIAAIVLIAFVIAWCDHVILNRRIKERDEELKRRGGDD